MLALEKCDRSTRGPQVVLQQKKTVTEDGPIHLDEDVFYIGVSLNGGFSPKSIH